MFRLNPFVAAAGKLGAAGVAASIFFAGFVAGIFFLAGWFWSWLR